MRDDRFIDREIDETARRLSEGEPGGAIRARVAERLAELPGQLSVAGYQLSIGRLVSLAGVAAAILVAVMLWRGPSAQPLDVLVGRTPSDSPGEPDKVSPTSVVTRNSDDARPTSVVMGLNGARPTSEVIARDVPPVTAVVVSELESIEIETLDTSELVLDPMEPPMMIAIEAIHIPPLEIPQ